MIQKQALPPSRFAASQRNVYQQPYSQPPGNALQYPPQTLPQQRGIPPQQPMSQQQIQSMLASGQAQYMMIPGLGLTLVPIMQLSHPPPALPVLSPPPCMSFSLRLQMLISFLQSQRLIMCHRLLPSLRVLTARVSRCSPPTTLGTRLRTCRPPPKPPTRPLR